MDFKPHDRVELVHTNDEYTKLRPGARGSVIRQTRDDWGTVVAVAWDDGSSLSILLAEGDRIKLVGGGA